MYFTTNMSMALYGKNRYMSFLNKLFDVGLISEKSFKLCRFLNILSQKLVTMKNHLNCASFSIY